MTKKKAAPRREEPEPEHVREYLLKEAEGQKGFLTKQSKEIKEYAKKHDNLFLYVAVNYELMIERVDANIRELTREP